MTTTADGDTRYAYQAIFDNDSTRYDGRIWTDKSVLTSDITYTGNVHEYDGNPISDGSGRVTVELDENAGENFLVSYSALASTTSVINQSQSPIDMVIVLDLSPMSNSTAGKVDALLTAVQEAIDSMIAANPQNRVAVVAYSSQAAILLPLDIYTDVSFTYQGTPTQRSTVTCTYVSNGTSQNTAFTIAGSNGSGVNKYTQMAVYTGMKILADVEDTTILVGDDDTVVRQPVLILCSEGEPKIASTNITAPTQSLIPTEGWSGFDVSTPYTSETNNGGGVEILRNYRTADNANPGPDNDDRHAQTFATLLTAAYMKKVVTGHYFGDVPDDDREALVYTVGIRTSSANSPSLAQIVLDPTNYLVDNANQFSNIFIGYADSYFGAGASVSIPDAGADDHQTTFADSSILGLTAEDLKYNDLFFNVTGDGSNLDFGDVFGDILTDITSSAAQGSTQVDDNVDPTQGGYLTYADPIGEYMEVKDVKALIINDVIYRTHQEPVVSTSNGTTTTTYVFNGMANNPVYGAQELRHIEIQVTTEANGQETLQVNIPAALLPLRLTTVLIDNDDNVVRYAHNSTYPFRLVYSVGLQSGVLEDGSVNMDSVSDEYIADNTVDGQVQFYAGDYSGGIEKGQVGNQGRTIGDAYVTYTPALDNPFYYVTEDTPLYIQNADGAYSRATGTFDSEQTYYFDIFYYTAAEDGAFPAATLTTTRVSRPGSSLREQSIGPDPEGLCLKAGEPRLGNLNDFLREKGEDNRTGTAQIYLYLYYTGDETTSHSFKVYHGNNGRLSAPLPSGTLSITKQVVGNPGAGEPTEFIFEITAKYAVSNTPVTGTDNGVDFDGNGVGTFQLKAGETKIFSIQPNTQDGVVWRVKETTELASNSDGSGWSTTVSGSDGIQVEPTQKSASGTLMPGESETVTFTNTYTTPTDTLTVHKDVTGDVANADTDVFSFVIHLSGLGNNSATSGADTITPEDDGSAAYSFTLSGAQSRSFTIPAGVSWTVEETTPLNDNWTTAVSNSDASGTEDSNDRSASGTIRMGETTDATFTNDYTSPGALVISKTVEGKESAQGTSYSFIITLTRNGQPVIGIIDGVEFTNGTATISLAAGESKTIQNLPAGTQWMVTEIATLPDGWTTTVNGRSSNSADGIIQHTEVSTAAFVNSAPGMLAVSKAVAGTGGSEQTFSFTLTCGGKAETFTLTSGASQTFTLPAGTAYTVTETDPGSNWGTTVNGITGREVSGTIQTGLTDTAAFVNTYQETPVNPDPNPGGDHGGGTATTYVTLHYESNGGTEYEDERYRQNAVVDLDKVPTREGYTFTGWYADAALTEPIDDIRMTSDKTVYAGWEATGVPALLNGEDHFAYVIGYADGTVRPLEQISRAEVATIIFRLLNPEVRDENLTATNTFEDVDEGMWYNTAISTLARLGIVYGRTAETFDPDASITRAEFAAICARFDDSGIQAGSNFTDISGHWAAVEIERAATLGWIRGYSDGTFRPNHQITRAEAMTLINRVLQRLPENEDDLLPDMNIWPDNRPEDWYYLAVQEATNSHDFDRKGDGVHEQWTEINADPDWKQYEE